MRLKSASSYIICILLLLTLCFLPACSVQDTPASDGISSDAAAEAEPIPEDTVIRLISCGDTVTHMPVVRSVWSAEEGDYDFTSITRNVADDIAAADFAIINLETTFSGNAPTGYPMFSAPDALAYDLVDVGFDLVSTANNHCMDSGYLGLVRTLDVLDAAGMPHLGTYRTQEEAAATSGVYMTEVDGIKLAFVCYTFSTNGIPPASDKQWSVNLYNQDVPPSLDDPRWAHMAQSLATANELGADITIALIHWGAEYITVPHEYQVRAADFLIEYGADLIFGSHAHVPQSMEYRTVRLADGSINHAFVSYCLGNFFSNQSLATVGHPYTDLTALLSVELTKDGETGEVSVTEAGYRPCLVVSTGGDYRLVDVHEGMAQYEAGDTSQVDAALYARLTQALSDSHKIMGQQFDLGLDD